MKSMTGLFKIILTRMIKNFESFLKALKSKAPALVGLVLFSFLLLPSAKALILCRLGKEVRTLRIEKGPGTCKAIYTKSGIDKQIGASAMSAEGCTGIVGGVRENLEKAGWKCKEAKEAKISVLKLDEEL